jgi:hypothetical protein
LLAMPLSGKSQGVDADLRRHDVGWWMAICIGMTTSVESRMATFVGVGRMDRQLAGPSPGSASSGVPGCHKDGRDEYQARRFVG